MVRGSRPFMIAVEVQYVFQRKTLWAKGSGFKGQINGFRFQPALARRLIVDANNVIIIEVSRVWMTHIKPGLGQGCQFSGCDACYRLRVTRYAIRAANLGIK